MLIHLDGGTMNLVAGGYANDAGKLICHCVAFELDGGGLALLDTGVGAAARKDPRKRLGALAPALRVDRDPANTVAAQLERLGHAASDVTDILITHLDIDHASGLDEFPGATVHLHRTELDAALKPVLRDRSRYLAVNWAHGPNWAPFDTPDDTWFGFDAITLLGGAVKAIPLPGHTRGHTGYAIRDGERWFLHAGDAFYHAGAITPGARPSRYLQIFERAAAARPRLLSDNHRRLAEVAQHTEVTVACTHEPAMLT
jgi:glyoxylase-like metal-dependent hydrolase (beta-lactamase superfamily II)